MKLLNCLYLFLLFLISCSRQQVDTIIKGATIYTVNDAFDTCSVIAIDKGKIVALGDNTLLDKFVATETIDAKGQYIYPGFIDAHCHYTGFSMDRYKLELYGVTSFSEMLKQINQYAVSNKRTWIEGRSWNNNIWLNKQLPTKDSLDILFPNTPVFMMRIDGHVALCNSKALQLAGIDEHASIEGGVIEKRGAKLTGIVEDNAMKRVQAIIPKLSDQEVLDGMLQTQKECFEMGLTSLVDCGLNEEILQHLRKGYTAGKILIRLSVLLGDTAAYYDKYLQQKPYKDERLHIAGFKVFADGSLGSHSALLKESYHDKHNHVGTSLQSLEQLQKKAARIIQSNYQLCVHAIGDATVKKVLDAYSTVLPQNNDRRWRIEHAQVVDTADIYLFGKYNIVPSVQPTHAISDMNWAIDRLGQSRMQGAYAYQKLLQQNKWLPLGTDFPVEGMNPLHTFHAAVFRKDKNQLPHDGFMIENKLSREDALRGITIWAAKSTFDDDTRGSLAVGKNADFVILTLDLMKASPKEIYDAKVCATYLDGKAVYTKNRD